MGNTLKKVNYKKAKTTDTVVATNDKDLKYLEYVGKTTSEVRKLMTYDYPTYKLIECDSDTYYNEILYTNALRALVSFGRVKEISKG